MIRRTRAVCSRQSIRFVFGGNSLRLRCATHTDLLEQKPFPAKVIGHQRVPRKRERGEILVFPCKFSGSGQHKWGNIRFTTRDRCSFLQSCRRCGMVKTVFYKDGKTVQNILPPVENQLSKSGYPTIKDIDKQSGEIK